MRTIIRVQHSKEKPYTVLSNQTIRDQSIDFRSLGLLTYLLSLPDDWQLDPRQLAKERNLDSATVYRMLSRLIKSGYVYRSISKIRDKAGRFTTSVYYVVFEDKEARTEFKKRDEKK